MNMKQDFFKVLPSEMIVNILSRLPVRAVVTSKCVCKPWLHLLETDDFTISHSSKSVPSLVEWTPMLTQEDNSSECTVFDLEEEETDIDQSHECRYNPLTKFVFPHSALMVGSANGFLCLRKRDHVLDVIYICNPITLEYIELRHPRGVRGTQRTYGFGRSKMTGEHKVLRVLHNHIIGRGNTFRKWNSITKLEYDVYTLGTGSWRSVEVDALLDYGVCSLSFGAFVNGCLHWIVSDLDGAVGISCFDLETECFSTFLVPPTLEGRRGNIGDLCVLKDSLCFCDAMSSDDIVIWLLNECGIEKSWSKEYVIAVNPDPDFIRYGHEIISPIKVFKGGDILMLWKWQARPFFYYSSKMKTIRRIDILGDRRNFMNSMLLAPSFVSLKSFGMEDVVSF